MAQSLYSHIMKQKSGLPSLLRPKRLAVRAAYQIRQITSGMTLGVRMMLLKDGGVMLVRHTYLPGWHMPGGGVDAGESILEAAVREAREEAGVEIAEPAQLFGVYRNGKRDHVALFISRDWEQARSPRLPSLEISACEMFDLNALPDDISAGTRARIAEIVEGSAPSRDW